MTMLEEQLREFGERLDVDGVDDGALVARVLARLDGEAEPDGSQRHARRSTPMRIAAAATVLVVAVVVAVPSSRRTVAGWFGFDGAQIERSPRLDGPATPSPLGDRGVGSTTVVDGDDILVAEILGTLDNPGLGKVLGADVDVTEVTVNGAFALWIDGAPHEVSFFDADGEIVFRGFAGNTLLWQDGEVIRRLEGFDTVGAAIVYAESLD